MELVALASAPRPRSRQAVAAAPFHLSAAFDAEDHAEAETEAEAGADDDGDSAASCGHANGFHQRPHEQSSSDLLPNPQTFLPLSASFPSSSSSSSSFPPSDGRAAPRFGWWSVWAAVVTAQLAWSVFHVVGIVTFPYIPSFVLPSLRALMCVPTFFALGYWRQSPTFFVVAPRDWALIAVSGVLGNFLTQQFLNAGLALTSAADAGLIQPIIPVVTTILAVAKGQESLTRGKLSGTAISTLGSVLIVVAERSTASSGDPTSSSPLRTLGIGLIMAQSLSWSVYLVIQRPVLQRGVSVLTFTFLMFLVGGLCHIVFGAYWTVRVDWAAVPWYIWLGVLYIGFGATVAAFLLYIYAASHLPASVMGLCTLCSTVFSSVLGVALLGETFTAFHALGGLLIAAGLLIVVHTKARDDRAQATKAKLAAIAAAADARTGEEEEEEEEVSRSAARESNDAHSNDGDGDGSDDEGVSLQQLSDCSDDAGDVSAEQRGAEKRRAGEAPGAPVASDDPHSAAAAAV